MNHTQTVYRPKKLELNNKSIKICPLNVQKIYKGLNVLLLKGFAFLRTALKTVLSRLKLFNGSLLINTRDIT